MISAKQKPLLLTLLLIVALTMSYATPRPKYKSTAVLKKIWLPNHMTNWHGEDVQQEVNLGKDQYFYINDIRTKKYVNAQGVVVYFTLLDAGNFHHPRLCFTGAGYTPEDLPDTKFKINRQSFHAPTLFFKKAGADTLVMYWLCIDKQRVNWTGQKVKEFWYSLIGKKRTGFTVRLDIPTSSQNIKAGMVAAQDLVTSLSKTISRSDAEYIFGK